MLNQKAIFKQKSKSKIFITILCIFGLLFSWSCSCKNRVSDPNETPINGGITNKKPDETPTGTFSMSAATDNVVTSIVKSSTTSISDIKISFVSANNYAYTMDYTVEDSETDEAKKLTKADFQLANKVLTAKDSVATKVKLVDSSGGPTEKTITINFTFKANDTSLKNNTQTLSVEVKLTHAQNIEKDKNAKKDFIEKVLRRGRQKSEEDNTDLNNIKAYLYNFSEGTFNVEDNTFTVKNSHTGKLNMDVRKSELKRYAGNDIEVLAKPEISSAVFNSETGGGENDDDYTLIYDVTFADSYEVGITQIKFKFERQPADNKTPNKFIE